MQHDIYSLGVILLEIGLWTSFVLCDSQTECSSPVPNNILMPEDSRPGSLPGSASQTKLKLEDLAVHELPVPLGRRYTDVVLLCLRCLDPASDTNQDSNRSGGGAANWTDEDGVTIGVRYIENVLQKLQEITM
jgi:hypothetical protein